MRKYACPRVHKTHNVHAFMISMNESKIYKRVHVTVYILAPEIDGSRLFTNARKFDPKW